MSEPFVAEIRIVAFTFAPRGWADCSGQLLPLSQNTALFSLLGTTYGGDGKTTFALPDLSDRVPMHPGQSPGLTNRSLGEEGGQSSVTLLTSQIPPHSHTPSAQDALGNANTPAAGLLVAQPNANARFQQLYRSAGTTVALAPQAISPTGGGQAHENRQPYLGVRFIIALQGIFPQRP